MKERSLSPQSASLAERIVPESERRILRNSLWMIFQPLSLNLISIVVAGYITRALGEERFGQFALAFAYADLALYATSMGLTSVTIRDVARDPAKAPLYNARISALRILVAFLLAAVVSGVGVWGDVSWEAGVVVLLAAFTVPLRTWGRTMADSFSSFEEQRLTARYEMAGGMALTGCSLLALWLYPGMISLALAYFVGPVVSLVLLYRGLSRRHFRPRLSWDTRFLLRKLREGLPFFGTGMLTAVMYRVDSIILDALHGPAVVGVYVAVSYQMVQRLRVVPEAMAGAVYPALARAKDEGERSRYLGCFLRYSLSATVPIGVGALLVGDDLVALLFGESFREGGEILAVVAWSVPLWGIIQLCGMTLASVGREREALLRRAMTTGVFLVAALLLVPPLAALGSAIAFTLALLVEAVYLLASLVRGRVGLWGEVRLGRILGANLAMSLAVWGAGGLPVWAAILVGALSYGVAAVVLGVAPRAELRALFFNQGEGDRKGEESPLPHA